MDGGEISGFDGDLGHDEPATQVPFGVHPVATQIVFPASINTGVGIHFSQNLHEPDVIVVVTASAVLFLLVVWMVSNTFALRNAAFDPYPYILLNLVLSCLAALQAPIIMMSQNRSSERDRVESTHDYETDLKAEIEIASLHDKVDHLLHAQWERMVELQEMQMELLTELTRRPR